MQSGLGDGNGSIDVAGARNVDKTPYREAHLRKFALIPTEAAGPQQVEVVTGSRPRPRRIRPRMDSPADALGALPFTLSHILSVILFKASGTTYQRVVRQARHAFPFSPSEVRRHEFVLLSKNREDCRPTENQIQYVAKVLGIEAVASAEIEEQFPGVNAAARWSYLAKLYWSRPLKRSFNLSQVAGLDPKRYATAQEFARLDNGDEVRVFNFLLESNPETILDFVNNAEPSDC